LLSRVAARPYASVERKRTVIMKAQLEKSVLLSDKTNPDGASCPTTGTACTLDCLQKGQRGRVSSVAGPNRCRLMELGFTSGTEVEVSRRAAFGGPLEIRLRSYRLSLRCEEAAGIRVETAS